jgi:hypothetical protein
MKKPPLPGGFFIGNGRVMAFIFETDEGGSP